MEYRLRGLTPNQEYQIKVKVPVNSRIEKALPAFIPITLGQADSTGIDFVVLTKPSKIDVRGYVTFTDEVDKCPSDRIKNLQVELLKINENEEEHPEIIKMPFTCQFTFTKLQKAQYNIKVIENQVKTYSKTIFESTLELDDDKEISEGIKNLNIDISKSKGGIQDHLNYSILSPSLICILLFIIFQWDYSLVLFNTFTGIFTKKKQYEVPQAYYTGKQRKK